LALRKLYFAGHRGEFGAVKLGFQSFPRLLAAQAMLAGQVRGRIVVKIG